MDDSHCVAADREDFDAGRAALIGLIPKGEITAEDVVRLRKLHPCGGYDWRVVRPGADIGLRCRTCGHHVLLARAT